MKLGLHIAATEWAAGAERLGPTLQRIVETAEEAGFDAIDVVDHVWQHPILGGPTKSQIEAYTTLGFIAAHTRRVRLLTLATAASYRPAGLLAKMVTTLDVLSGGRAMLGIGAGDYAEEAVGLGLPFGTLSERFEVLEETVQACLRMWDGERGDDEPFQQARAARTPPQRAAEPRPAPPADPHCRRR
jgi:alkanesulfonate monooxygenase SsuD/methylene tetrahydromethanopterin reductase-like flavin-dependent oxidoreductase (luciferase family)